MDSKIIAAIAAVILVVVGASAFIVLKDGGNGGDNPDGGAATQYTLSFVSYNGSGTAPDNLVINAGATFTMPANTFTHDDDGYNTWDFVGWQNDKTNEIYYVGTTYTADDAFKATLWDGGTMRYLSVFQHRGSDITFTSNTEISSNINNSVGYKVDNRNLAICQETSDLVTYYTCDLGFYTSDSYYGWSFTLNGADNSPSFGSITISVIKSASDAPSGTVKFAEGVYINPEHLEHSNVENCTLYVVEHTDIGFTFDAWDCARTFVVADNDGSNDKGQEAHGQYAKLGTPADYGLTIPEGKTFLGWTKTCGSGDVDYKAGDYFLNGYYSKRFYAVWSS